MAVHTLLQHLEQLGVELQVVQEQLHFRAPAGVLTREIRSRIAQHKSELMVLLDTAARSARVHAARVTSDVDLPLTPNYTWYLNTFEPEGHTWAMTLAIKPPVRLCAGHLSGALRALFAGHDVFRLRMRRNPSGRWILGLIDDPGEPQVEFHEMNDGLPDRRPHALQCLGARLQSRLSIQQGPVLVAGLCQFMPSGEQTLIVSLHHHIADAYSAGILVEELLDSCRETSLQASAAQRYRTSSYRDFLLRLDAYTHEPLFLARALSFWRNPDRLRTVAQLPADMPGGHHTDLNSRRLAIYPLWRTLSRLQQVGNPRGLSLNDFLLIALAHAYHCWSAGGALRVDVENNGRADIVPGVDLLRTIGPTTMKFPLLLAVDPKQSFIDSVAALGTTIRETTDNLLGYGALRYTCGDPDVQAELAACPSARVFFNNRAAMQTTRSRSLPTIPVEEISITEPGQRENPVSYDLMIDCTGMPEQFVVTFIYSGAIHRDATIEGLARSFQEYLQALADI